MMEKMWKGWVTTISILTDNVFPNMEAYSAIVQPIYAMDHELYTTY